MVTWVEILMWREMPLLDAYEAVSAAEASIEVAGEVLYRAEVNFSSEGDAAESARRVIVELRQDMDLVEGQLSDLMLEFRRVAAEVEELSFRVRNVQLSAVSALLEVSEFGVVSYSQTLWNMIDEEFSNLVEVTPEEWYHLISRSDTTSWRRAAPVKVELEEEIRDLIKRACEIDESLARVCDSILEGEVSSRSSMLSGDNISVDAALTTLNELGEVAEVRAFWDVLSPSVQESLVTAFPDIIGSFNGIPFEVRLKANRVNSLKRVSELEERVEELDSEIDALGPRVGESAAFDLADLKSDRLRVMQELEYINAVLEDPDRGFILFDPGSSRIIEQNGPLRDSVTEIYTHVPGTGASLSSFIDESATGFPVALREQGAALSMEISTFTYMDGGYTGKGGWITWPGGGRGNTNAEYLVEKGRQLADFQSALRLEDGARGADINIGGHSAGQSPIFASEVMGAWYDQSSSFAGSYSPVEWKGNAATSYDHFYYEQEPINLMNIGSAEHPYKSKWYEQHRFDHGEGVMGYLNGVGHHTRVNSADPNNDAVILEQLHQMQLSGQN